MMKCILSYLVALQSASLLSTLLVCIVFFAMKYVFHVTTKKWLRFFSTYQMSKISTIMILSELLSLMIVVPLAFQYFSLIQAHYVKLIVLSIILYTLFPLIFKIRAVKKMIKEKEDVEINQGIYL